MISEFIFFWNRNYIIRPKTQNVKHDTNTKFMLLTQQMQEVGFSQNDLDSIFSLLAVVLHLGNLDFHVAETEQNNHYFDLNITGYIIFIATVL